MSSIFGIYNTNYSPVHQLELVKMEHALNHWDADKKGCWVKDAIGLGHLMMYNTPESLNEVQPLLDNHHQLSITADARIDNREDLFIRLCVPRALRGGMTDSQLILQAYIKYKEECVKYLVGDFSFAIWDEAEQQLFCARDHMGIRPFFYYKGTNFFAFASEKKGLLAVNCLNKEIDHHFLLGMAGGLYQAPEKTMYRHIYRLPAAHTLTIRKTRMVITRYWDLDTHKETRYASSGQYVEAFREKFTEAVRCRLRSNYDVGCELSGGLDSSGITCIAASLLHQQNKPITTYSYTLPNNVKREGVAKHTEDAFADEVCTYAQVDNPVKIYSSGYKNFLEEIDLALFTGDGPDTHAQVWNWPVKKIAGVYKTRVLLSGYPGDELVTNYSPMQYLEFCRMQTLLKYFKGARSEDSLKGALKTLLLSKLSKPVKMIFKNYLLNNSVEGFRRSKYNYLSDSYFNEIKHYIPIMHEWPGSYRELQKSLICDPIRAQRLESEIQNGRMNKVTTCFPMADIRLMEFVLSVPVTEKSSPEADRWLFRRGMQGYMPLSIVNRKDKTGAVLPFVELEWVARQQKAKNWMIDFDPTGQKLPFFNYSKFLSHYNWQINDNSDYRGWIQPSRNKQVESIIRWYEVNN